MQTTYRIETWSRDQIQRAEYVTGGGQPISLRYALEWVDDLRSEAQLPSYPIDYRIVDNATGQLVDEADVRRPWWQREYADHAYSVFELSDMLAQLAAALRAQGDEQLHRVWVSLSLQAMSTGGQAADPARVAAVDAIAARLGLPPADHSPSGLYGTGDTIHVYGSVRAPLATAVPVASEQPSTPEPDAEKRCACGQPWALLISGNARHADGCENEALGEAGLPDDLPLLPADIGPHTVAAAMLTPDDPEAFGGDPR